MHDDGIRLTVAGIDTLVKTKATPILVSLFLSAESLLLKTGGVDNVNGRDAFLQLIRLQHLVSCAAQVLYNLCRHPQSFGRNQDDLYPAELA